MPFDNYFHGRKRDNKGNTINVDLYPRGRVARALLCKEMEMLLQIFSVTIDTFRELTGGVIDMATVCELGRSDEDVTRGRERLHDSVTNATVLHVLNGTSHEKFHADLRKSLFKGCDSLGEEHVPAAGMGSRPIDRKLPTADPRFTGLPMLYNNIEYRVRRFATFEHEADAKQAVEVLRSLEKLACANWAEQDPGAAAEMAHKVRRLTRAE